MSYCRFQNTLKDLRDCEEHMDDELKSTQEEIARKSLIRLCKTIVDNHGQELEEGNEPLGVAKWCLEGE
jgi:hypothetical protein